MQPALAKNCNWDNDQKPEPKLKQNVVTRAQTEVPAIQVFPASASVLARTKAPAPFSVNVSDADAETKAADLEICHARSEARLSSL